MIYQRIGWSSFVLLTLTFAPCDTSLASFYLVKNVVIITQIFVFTGLRCLESWSFLNEIVRYRKSYIFNCTTMLLLMAGGYEKWNAQLTSQPPRAYWLISRDVLVRIRKEGKRDDCLECYGFTSANCSRLLGRVPTRWYYLCPTQPVQSCRFERETLTIPGIFHLQTSKKSWTNEYIEVAYYLAQKCTQIGEKDVFM